jgi:hypothetical protein
MREPNIEWPSSDETSDILAATGKTQSELEELIRASIRKAEFMAKLGRDHIGEVQKKAEDAWTGRWNADEVLVMWFGRVEKANHVEDVHRRIDDVYDRLASHVLTIHVREDLPQNFDAQNLGSFISPDTFRVAVGWLEDDLEERASVVIHELLHQWFKDQRLSKGNTVYGKADAKQLAMIDPQKARRSPENYEHYCLYLTTPDGASAWDAIGGTFPRGAPVAAVAREPGRMDLFVTGNDGVVYTSSSVARGAWSGAGNRWTPIGGVFPDASPVCAVSRDPDGIDLFTGGNNGVVYTSRWSPAEGWSGMGNRWTPIGGVFPVRARVHVVARSPDRLDAFVTGNDGVVYASAWEEAGTWSGVGNRWWPIGGVFPGGAPVFAVTRAPDDLTLFITGKNGVVYTSSWSPGKGWSGIGNRWTPIGGVFPPGAPVHVVSRSPDRLDAFVTGNDGVVYTSAWQEGGSWSGAGNRWWPIGGVFPRAAPVCAVARGLDRLDLFITGNNGVVYTSSWSPGQGWSGVGNRWTPLGEVGPAKVPDGAPVSALVDSVSGSGVHVFVTGSDGVVHTRHVT